MYVSCIARVGHSFAHNLFRFLSNTEFHDVEFFDFLKRTTRARCVSIPKSGDFTVNSDTWIFNTCRTTVLPGVLLVWRLASTRIALTSVLATTVQRMVALFGNHHSAHGASFGGTSSHLPSLINKLYRRTRLLPANNTHSPLLRPPHLTKS